MKSLLLLVFLCFQSFAHSQITFEQVSSPADFSLSTIRKSPIGEYFVQAYNDENSIYTSMNGEDWTKSLLPVGRDLDDIQFLSDGTPVLKSPYADQLIRRNGLWYVLGESAGWDDVKACFVKDDSLFIFQDETFAYSVDKGQTFTTIFTSSEPIIAVNSYLWKFDHHFVLYHTGGLTDLVSVFSEDGELVLNESILLTSTRIAYNSCGEVLFYDRDHYYSLKDQGLNFFYGLTTDIIPDYSNYLNFFSQDGHYYLREGSVIYKTSGCNFEWDTLVSNDLITYNREIWISHQEDIILYSLFGDLFIESKGINPWEEHALNIHSPHISSVIESVHNHQIARTSNALFGKGINDVNWTELDSSGHQLQYSPNGDLYVNKSTDILYSTDNGISYSTISIPDFQWLVSYYNIEVLDDQVIFLIQQGSGESYYTLNNGQDWIPVILSSSIKYAQVKLVGNYIIIAELKYGYSVTRINITSKEIESLDLGEFFETGGTSATILDDGTIYFHAFDVNAGHSGLFRYKHGESVEYINNFQSLGSVRLFTSSGTDLYGFDQDKYYVFDGDNLTVHSYTGLPDNVYVSFFLSENEYLYAIEDNRKIFRSTEPLSFGQFITGSVYDHVNQDCALDTSDATLQYWQVKLESDEYLRIKTSDHEGNFSFAVPDGQYKLSSQPINFNWELCDSDFNITIDENNPMANQDFMARGLNECAGFEIDFSTPLLRRCFDNYYSVRVRNTGPQASEGTTLTLEFDPFFNFISAAIPYTLVGDSILKFDLGVLAVNDEISFHVFFRVSCNAPIGAEHCLAGSLEDVNECGGGRSTYSECQQNIGSYDPNDKRIFNEEGKESETVDKNEYIYYHIRFQNTGTDTAFNIHIVDPLSPKLDLGTLEMLSASHPYHFIITDGPALKVDFDHILLPDSSTNEPASHGFFKFRIKPLPEFDYGTNIPNQASIYFDFNDPVLTKETTVSIQPRVGTKEPIDFIEFEVYPNPVNNILTLIISEDDLDRVDSYEIIDQLGQNVNHVKFLKGNSMKVAHLAPGIYNLILKEKERIVGVTRFVKM